jgi:hypothetical protein
MFVGVFPDAKLVIPESWRKSSVSSVPADLGTVESNVGAGDEQ